MFPLSTMQIIKCPKVDFAHCIRCHMY